MERTVGVRMAVVLSKIDGGVDFDTGAVVNLGGVVGNFGSGRKREILWEILAWFYGFWI